MKENEILFVTKKDLEDIEDIKPIPASKYLPQWFKNTTLHKPENLTIKGCMPVQDALTSGYLLKLPQDMEVTYNFLDSESGKKIIAVNFAMERQDYCSHEMLQKRPQSHPTFQVGGPESFLAQENSPHGLSPIPKIMNPWIIKTPPGYSCLFLPPLLREEDYFNIIPGVVDTDRHRQSVNFPFIFNKHKYPSYKKIFRRGMPYVQVIPFKREDWKMKIKYDKEFSNVNINWATKIINRYKQLFWNKKKYL